MSFDPSLAKAILADDIPIAITIRVNRFILESSRTFETLDRSTGESR